MTIKTLPKFTAARSIRAQLNHINKTPEVLAVIGQNIAAQLIHGNKNHLTSAVDALKNKDDSLNQHAKTILKYLNAHDGLKVTYSAKNGAKVKGKPEAVHCFLSFTEVKEKEKAAKREEAKAKREEAKANKGNEADIEEQAKKLATMLKGYTLEQAKSIMLLAEQELVKSIIAKQEKTEGKADIPSLTTDIKGKKVG